MASEISEIIVPFSSFLSYTFDATTGGLLAAGEAAGRVRCILGQAAAADGAHHSDGWADRSSCLQAVRAD